MGLRSTWCLRLFIRAICDRKAESKRRMKAEAEKLSNIYNFRAINEQLGTAGQPSEAQLRFVRDAGFDVVINLALPTSDNALPNEGSIVTALGMAYVHIPI